MIVETTQMLVYGIVSLSVRDVAANLLYDITIRCCSCWNKLDFNMLK